MARSAGLDCDELFRWHTAYRAAYRRTRHPSNSDRECFRNESVTRHSQYLASNVLILFGAALLLGSPTMRVVPRSTCRHRIDSSGSRKGNWSEGSAMRGGATSGERA